MKILGLILGVVFGFANPALAEKTPDLDPETCKQLVTHQPAPGVEYKPGIDVQGKPVVEADLTKPQIAMPEKFSFDLTLDVAAYAGIQVPAGIEGTGKIGAITYENGRFSFDGKPLTGGEEAALVALCTPKPELQNSEKKD